MSSRYPVIIALVATMPVLVLLAAWPTGATPRSRPASATQPSSAPSWLKEPPPAAAEFVEKRREMVERQIARPRDGREPVRDGRVLEAMRAVPRHAFVPSGYRPIAYQDSPLPIGHGQTISQPYIVALMTEHLDIDADEKILEVGTGSGYQAAVLAHLTPHVYSIEIVPQLAEQATRTLEEQGYTTVKTRYGDGYRGWPDAAPFDGIIVTCAADDLPRPLWNQLKPGGRIVIPTGGRDVQKLIVITKKPDGGRESRTITAVRFVPLVRTQPE